MDDKVRNVPAYIDPTVLGAVRKARREGLAPDEADRTYDELLVDALEQISMEQIRTVFAPAEAASSGGLMQRRQRSKRGSGGIQIQLRMTKAQEAELAVLEQDAGAPSRSAFVTAVYRLAYLPSDDAA